MINKDKKYFPERLIPRIEFLYYLEKILKFLIDRYYYFRLKHLKRTKAKE